MTSSLEQLRTEARALDADQRARLALDLLESLDESPSSADVEQAWNAEARERLAQYDRGQTKTVSADDLRASLDSRAQ